MRNHQATDEQIQSDLRALPAILAKLDAWVEQGNLGGATPNAADYQIAPSVRLLMCAEQLRPLIAPRASGRLAERLVPDFPGRIGQVFPSTWLPA